MARAIFPLQIERQYSGPLDVNQVFETTSTRLDYLSSALRYAGQLAFDHQTGKNYQLNVDKDQWIELAYSPDLNEIRALSSTWDSTYSSVSSLSGNWDSTYSSVSSLSSNWSSAYSSVCALSTTWASSGKFTEDLVVSLPTGKSFGRYVNGETIPATGKSVAEVIEMAVAQPLAPTVNFSSSTAVLFNQSSINNVLQFNCAINSLNATVASATIEYRRTPSSAWSVLSSAPPLTGTFTHSFTDPLTASGATNANGTDVIPFSYRYTLLDSKGASTTTSISITPQSYSAPSTGTPSIGSTTRYKGDRNSTYTATVTKNRTFIPITSLRLQRNVNGAGWTDFNSLSTISGDPASVSVTVSDNNDPTTLNANNIQYRLVYTDAYVGTPSVVTSSTTSLLSLVHRNVFLYSTAAALTINMIDSATIGATNSPGAILSNAKARTLNNITAPAGNYTYYAYASESGNLTAVTQNGALPVLDGFSVTDLVGTNVNTANVSYKVYKSNSTQAFTDVNSLQFQ